MCQCVQVGPENAPEVPFRAAAGSWRLNVSPPKGAATAMTVAMQDLVQERRLVTELPGPRSRELFARRQAAVVQRRRYHLAGVHRAGRAAACCVDVDGNSLIDLGSGIAVVTSATPRRGSSQARHRAGRRVHPHLLHGHAVRGVRRGLRAARRGSPPATTPRSPRCSTPAPRRSRTPSRSPGTPPAGPRSWCSTTPTTAAPT